jgi:calcium/calmodulin-dependent protein kinase I
MGICPNCKPGIPPPIPLASQRKSGGNIGSEGDSNPMHSKGVTFKSRYILGSVVGTGTFAVVHNCTDRETWEVYAVKILEKKKLDEETSEAFRKEVDLLKHTLNDCEYIIRCHEFFEDETTFYLVEEFADGGELFDKIAAQQVYNEKDANELVRSLLEAVRYCHSLHVVHRDLKPENILLTNQKSVTEDDSSVVKLADFGFATIARKNTLTRGCGTLDYVAPEILKHESYGKPVDMWSIGVIAYILLSGHVPFLGATDKEEMENIKSCNYEFDFLTWGYVSEQAKDFVKKLLVIDSSVRYTVEEALADPWIRSPDYGEMHRSLHKKSLNQSMHTWRPDPTFDPSHAPGPVFDLNASLYGSVGVLARSMHGVQGGKKYGTM